MKRLILMALAVCALAGAAHADDLRDFCPDRPLKGNAPCSVDKGYWQVESDLVNVADDRSGGMRTTTILGPNPTLKYGVTDTLDLEANIAPFEQVRTSGPAGTITASGISDLYLLAKWHLYGPNGADGIALQPYIKLPTARSTIGNGAVEGGLAIPTQKNIGDWQIGFMPEVDVLKDKDGSGHHLSTAASVNLTYSLPSGVNLGVELWGQAEFDPMGTVNQASFDVAAAWQPKGASYALDAWLNFGLNNQTPDVQVIFGVSRRF